MHEQTEQKFHENLGELAGAAPLLAGSYKKKLLGNIDVLTDSEHGIRFLYDQIGRLVEAGILKATVWEDPARLVPSLVGGTLKSGGENTLFEILSELRMVSIMQKNPENGSFSASRARSFLEEAMVHNLDLIFQDAAGPESDVDESAARKISSLFTFLTGYIPVESLKKRLSTEMELICLQRPVVTDRVLRMIRIVRENIPLDPDREEDRRLHQFVRAVYSPSDGAEGLSPEQYAERLGKASLKELETECRQLAQSMKDTGLAVACHAVLLRHVVRKTGLIMLALGLDKAGQAELGRHSDFVRELIRETIYPETARSCYGLSKLLERGLLSHQPVKSGLERILSLELHPDSASSIRKSRPDSTLDPAVLLAAECLGILGQPLGIGQGGNPTCQSARGISLWSSHAPGKLLRMIENAASTHTLRMRFEDQVIQSDELLPGLAPELDYNLDAVSVVLVPHLDKLYNEMMRRAANRGEDPHKWVNPAMYGHWIPTGFVSAYHYPTHSIRNYEQFVRIFYATHHPDYNGGHDLAYPNPVGIFLTSSVGKLIGFHAVSILRVGRVRGQTRIYLLNPNNEGRQRWQEDIRPTVAGNGERPGESSLPFHQFASRLYAFHYNPSDLRDPGKVDAAEVSKVESLARDSWGESYRWTETADFTI